MAAVELQHLSELLVALGQSNLAANSSALASSVRKAITQYGIMNHPIAGRVYAYEVDGSVRSSLKSTLVGDNDYAYGH